MWIFSRRLRRLRREECSKLHYPAEKYRLFGVVAVIAVLWFVCVNQRETFGASSGYIDWVLFRVILPQIAQITQRNAASCIISQRKTGWVGYGVHSVIVVFVVIAVLGFVCDYQRDLRETFGLYLYVKIEYSHVNILPQITQITQRGMQQAASYRRERQVELVVGSIRL